MHELSIAASIVKSLENVLDQHGGAYLVAAKLRIGTLSGVHRESLEFCLSAMAGESPRLKNAAFHVTDSLPSFRCRDCGHEFSVENPVTLCPSCGACRFDISGGDEMVIESVEFEEEPAQGPGEEGACEPVPSEGSVTG